MCGPCSEIYYHPEGSKSVEIWNLVFTQFNRVGEPPNNLRPLPSKNIDTGMGLERCASTLQGVPTNYHIDSILPIVQAAAEVCGQKYEYESDNGRRLRRITDHVRACTFAVHENVYPGANKEKYVVKRLLRRAVLDGHQMGLRDPFLHKLVPIVAEMMKRPYPELQETVKRVSSVIEKEEANFFGTIDAGLNHIDRVFDEMRRDNRVTVDGAVAAELYQTYGVPPELFESLAAEHNLAFDWQGYEHAMEEHGEVSGKVQHAVMGTRGPIDSLKQALHATEFLGYETTEADATIKGIIAGTPPNDHLCDRWKRSGHKNAVRVVLDRTPFYGESGGQVGDTGKLVGDGFEFNVTDTQKDGGLIVHEGHLVQGVMREGAKVKAIVDVESPVRHSAGPFGDAHSALRAAEESWHACAAARLEGRRGLAAVRLHELEPGEQRAACGDRDGCGRTSRSRGAGEVGDAAAGGCPQAGRDDAVRREVPRPGADGVDGLAKLSAGAVRRHASDEHGRGRAFRDSERGRCIGRHAADHGADRCAGGGACAQIESAASSRSAKLLGVLPHEVTDAVTRLVSQARELRKQLSSGGSAVAKPQETIQKVKTEAKAGFEQLKQGLVRRRAAAFGRDARRAAADRGA